MGRARGRSHRGSGPGGPRGNERAGGPVTRGTCLEFVLLVPQETEDEEREAKRKWCRRAATEEKRAHLVPVPEDKI